MIFSENKKGYSKFAQTFLLMIWAVSCFGFNPISQYYPHGLSYEIPVLAIMIICGYAKVQWGKYKIWLTLLFISLIGHYVSSTLFEKYNLFECVRTASFIHYIFVFSPLVLINPSIKDVENVIVWLGNGALFVYFLQYILLPVPIVQSLTSGWRMDSSTEFDIIRFNVTGELVMFLYLFYSLDQIIVYSHKRYFVPVVLVLLMCILHGYRSWIIAMFLSLIIQYLLHFGIKFNRRRIFSLFVLMLSLYWLLEVPEVQDVWNEINEKNETQYAKTSIFDIDRLITFEYFYEDRASNIIEWFFGAGFLKGLIDSSEFFSINWVDLGFIGLTFTGGIFMTICWLRLLILNINKNVPKEYTYLSVFSIFIILGTLTLPLAFNDRAPAIQALALYIGYKLTPKMYVLQKFKVVR